ncbi:myosin-1-like [Bradysia coprophila]|uniref:myosin-1-like n=1 Tax=Bradysia coprophila TaxID=38358 RepID=UPI00187D75DA|nr:myosin-1-like [Bradysia coprophila]
MIIHILIPDCIHSDHNVFFNILKNVVFKVGHAKLTEHYLDNAFKEGMKAREFQVDLHAAETWNIDSSKRDKISLWKLLGCWASRNCQTFGKILFKDKWETTNSRSVLAQNIDEFVYKTLKFILIELDVSESTLINLRHFVKVPVNEIGVENMVQISPKMKLFEIENNYWEKCWLSLERGEWLGHSHGEINNSIPFPSLNPPRQSLINSECATHSSGNSTLINFTRKRAYGCDLVRQHHSQSAMQSMVSDCDNITAINLTSNQSQRNDIPRSNGQAQSQSSRSSEPSMGTECNNVTPLDLTRKQSYDKDMRLNVSSATTTVMHEELQQRVNLLQDQLLLALQRELDQKNVVLDERNKSIFEAQKLIVVLQLQLIEQNSSNNDLRQQLEEKNKLVAENQESNELIQKQLAAQIDSTGSLQNLIDVLTKQEEMFNETVSALRSEVIAKDELVAQVREQNQSLQLKISEETESSSRTISAQRSEITATVELLSQAQESNALIQKQLAAQIDSTGSLQNLIDVLTKQEEMLTETVSALRSEVIAKDELVAQVREQNQSLQLKISEETESSSRTISAQRSEITATVELLSQAQESNALIQKQLAAQIDSTGSLQNLIDVLTKQEEMLTETVSALRSEVIAKDELVAQVREQNQSLQLKISEETESSSRTISTQRSEITATVELLSQAQESNALIQQQLTTRNESVAELRESVNMLQLQLTARDKSLTEVAKLKHEIQETIHCLESELTKKDSSINELQHLVASLTLQLDQKNSPDIIPALSAKEPEMSCEKVEQTLQPVQQCLPTVFGADRHNSQINDQNISQNVQAKIAVRTSSRIRLKHSKKTSRFVQPPDAAGMTRAEDVTSEYPSDDKKI